MGLTINTNLSGLTVQKNLNSATKSLNTSIERMTTGYKINSANDDAAGYAVATKMATKLSSIEAAQNNVAMGQSMISTLSENTELMITHLQRIRDLCEEGANGTYATDSIKAIDAEMAKRFGEIIRIAESTEYNGMHLIKFADDNYDVDTNYNSVGAALVNAFCNITGTKTFNLQAGIDSTDNSKIILTSENYGLGGSLADAVISIMCANMPQAIEKIDNAISKLAEYQTQYGAVQNRLDSASEALDVQNSNLTSSLSTIKDADIANVSSEFVKQQILQQASATLLSTANQTPSIALQLI